ncbi:MAG: hypothetical protein R3C61_24130 [Bacteroidia bacterium]
MIPVRRNIVSVFLFFCLVMPFTGAWTVLHLQCFLLRQQIKSRLLPHLGEAELVNFRFARDKAPLALRWFHSREFELDGRMYDVVSLRVSEDSIIAICWPDLEESVLNQKIARLTSGALNDDPARKESQKRIISFFYNLFKTEESRFCLSFSARQAYLLKNDGFDRLSPCFSPPVPPPEKG